jgi:hypothetical protein
MLIISLDERLEQGGLLYLKFDSFTTSWTDHPDDKSLQSLIQS